jgi:predicted TIM-barrel fold metal-dependent hydrolase
MAGRLPLLIHMGDERGDASSPARLLNVINAFPTLTIIAPHLGGYTKWDEAMETIIGRDIYIDTSSALAFMPPEKAAAIIRAHGIDKVLFGSDYPMWLHRDELERFFALGFTDDENEKILYSNAAKLLGVKEDD